MKLTISDCMLRINQSLNYPALAYEDVSHFFDQAISELNTSLRIALPTFTEMRLENTSNISASEYAIALTSKPTSDSIIFPVEKLPDSPSEFPVAYVADPDTRLTQRIYVWKDNAWKEVDKVYGIVSGSDNAYELVIVDYSYAIWREISFKTELDFSVTNYLTTDWIILFIIPYVCFKFAVRNGDSGGLFSDEFTQGFQQLQTSYGVPNTVKLSTVAHLPAYKSLVEANLDNLNKTVPVRAITESMRVPNSIHTVHGAGVFDIGGWGI